MVQKMKTVFCIRRQAKVRASVWERRGLTYHAVVWINVLFLDYARVYIVNIFHIYRVQEKVIFFFTGKQRKATLGIVMYDPNPST